MELETQSLPITNKVIEAYYHDQQFIHTFFDYEFSETAFRERAQELSERSFKRNELSKVIRSFMEPFGISDQAEHHLRELESDALAVVGGQQAGILTGPLYSVHKAITVILLANKQREELGIPVVPVFWIAGEDHDLNEINHVYTQSEGQAVKQQYDEKFIFKWMASDAEYDKNLMKQYIQDIFAKYGETVHTKRLLKDVLSAVESESTFTTFFVRLMNGMFMEEGLLFIDSAFKELRKLEAEYFIRLIEESEQLADLIVQQETRFAKSGFGQPISADQDAANLFYIHETGRILLSRESGNFTNRQTGVRFSKQELVNIAKEKPEMLSNNVATRPIMQDLVFPVLSFVGGPGELSYWALLKEAFHHIGIKMPIFMPRISMTLISPQASKAMTRTSLQFDDVLAGRLRQAYDEYVSSLRNERLDNVLDETEVLIEKQYDEMMLALDAEDRGMKQILLKNLSFHKKQLDYVRKKAEESIYLKDDQALRQYRVLEGELYPDGSLQERVYTPYLFMNSYGPSLVKDLLRLPLSLNGQHHVVYL
ncbi:bacillithiol biosynthesis cysteine-adding enzyme BshC [Sporosarcina sp. Te-1]|uniref:bacillithiol biosynthesis cysteine-adding enzyme BshC n=1 Tax=Sporosarcina sp. Te-1 TaxID=2818390 RepID=UPI001A9DA0E8|nr:bacillithiol biosynthesis cysteine-adding enzyme BshC [Sporosarcina sp. Te-1]QTD42409.1 bacillithiol biosynthesis cysteine-adding enzyme BshC [Sporosarcina sp. Te-1]